MDDTENPENTENPESTENTADQGTQENLEAQMGDQTAEGDPAAGEETMATAAEHLRDTMGQAYDSKGLGAVFEVPVQVSAVLGRASMPVHQLLKLGRGAVIELDRRIGESIDIYVNNLLVARGEVVVVEDRLGITMTEIIKATSQK